MSPAKADRATMKALSDELVYLVTKKLLQDHCSAPHIAEWLVDHREAELFWLVKLSGGDDTERQTEEVRKSKVNSTRPKVYEIVREAVKRDFVRLNPPEESTLASNIWYRYQIDDDKRHIRVVNIRGRGLADHGTISDQIALAGANTVLQLILQVARKKSGDRVRVGLGAGRTAMNVARHLGRLVSSEPDCPKLAIHAVTSGFAMDPRPAPVTFFRFFDESKVDIEYVPLFSAPIVRYQDYEEVKQQPVVVDAFHRAPEIDVVVTSLASAQDPDGLLNQLLKNEPDDMINDLKRRGWIGDVQFLPYSESGPILLSNGNRAVTLFELDDLVERANADDKHVVLVAGPCNQCGRHKTDALAPLLRNKALRMWDHLITDIETAVALLEPDRPTDSPPPAAGRVRQRAK